jgi:hypothetical protein
LGTLAAQEDFLRLFYLLGVFADVGSYFADDFALVGSFDVRCECCIIAEQLVGLHFVLVDLLLSLFGIAGVGASVVVLLNRLWLLLGLHEVVDSYRDHVIDALLVVALAGGLFDIGEALEYGFYLGGFSLF